jgi:hypothetical protein
VTNPPVPTGYVKKGSLYYKFSYRQMDHPDAVTFCKNDLAWLAMPKTSQEYTYFTQLISGAETWVGLANPAVLNCTNASCTGNVFWQDGSNFAYENYISVNFVEPSQYIRQMAGQHAVWNDDNNGSYAVVCQFDPALPNANPYRERIVLEKLKKDDELHPLPACCSQEQGATNRFWDAGSQYQGQSVS